MENKGTLRSTYLQKILLICFVVSAVVYLLNPPSNQPIYWQTDYYRYMDRVFWKILPMLCLIAYVILTQTQRSWNKYSLYTLIGLCLSTIGDTCLVVPKLLIPGGAVFKMAHVSYYVAIVKGGLQQGGSKVTMCIFVILFIAVYIFSQSLTDSYIRKFGLLLYYVPLFAVGWKAATVFEVNLLDKATILSLVGACLFINSDVVLIINGLGFYIEHSRHIVMATYYGAQAARAISTSYYSD